MGTAFCCPKFPTWYPKPLTTVSLPLPEEPAPGRYADIAETITDEELALSALTIYHEARGESYECQKAVFEVILNRVLDDRFPNTISEVIYQPGQFTTAKLLTTAPIQEPACLAIAFQVVEDVLEETEYVLGDTYIYFATSKVNGKNHIKIDETYFSE